LNHIYYFIKTLICYYFVYILLTFYLSLLIIFYRFVYYYYRTKETLASGNLLSVINVLMQLRKVCNHPNLFEVRPTVSAFQMEALEFMTASLVWNAFDYDPFKVK